MIYLGIDLHKRYSYVVAINEKGQVVAQRRIVHNKPLWDQFLNSLPEPIEAVIEATLNWYFLADWLEPRVSRLVLANPLKVRAIAEAKIKTDRIDANILAQLLRTNLIPESHMSTKPAREHKNLLRHRISYVKSRVILLAVFKQRLETPA